MRVGNVAALEAADPQQGVYAIGLGQLSTFEDFVQAVRFLYPDLRVELRTEPTGGFAGFPHVRQVASDIGAAARELGWRPAFSLADTVAHFAPLCVSGSTD